MKGNADVPAKKKTNSVRHCINAVSSNGHNGVLWRSWLSRFHHHRNDNRNGLAHGVPDRAVGDYVSDSHHGRSRTVWTRLGDQL
ncbi:hypothetical protein [Arthrobacter sp. ISL-30]|uniref:hypothetical protein n=1 Tax=Arthrobacter sp. ISL-30 TaxID=2819109 RepID=UPI001BECC6E5|nr:hypothetical protein [Arthrobacter sp. ISL-30]